MAAARNRQGDGDEPRVFADRAEAGRLLGDELARRGLARPAPLVLALPRGGVRVAVEVADRLHGALDVALVRKVGHPHQHELALGAIGEDGAVVWDHGLLGQCGLTPDDLAATVAAERHELDRRRALYRRDRPAPDPAGRVVVVVDDGVATGSTARAALRSLRARGPARLVLAAPVAPADVVRLLANDADEVVVLSTPAAFGAVGRWYADFGQLSDGDVLAALAGS